MREVKACGVLLFRDAPHRQFLLMKHPERWDLPKGHIEPGETELECALREMYEETGIPVEHVRLDEAYRYETQRDVTPPYFNGETVRKTYVFFIGYLNADTNSTAEITLTEHQGFAWMDWNPPHEVNAFLIDPLLEDVAAYLQRQEN